MSGQSEPSIRNWRIELRQASVGTIGPEKGNYIRI
jgi:hypothetical protein